MLNCRACLWRCIQALDTSATRSQRLRRDAASTFNLGQRRLIRTSTTSRREFEARSGGRTEADNSARYGGSPWSNSPQAAKQQRQATAALKRKTDNDEGAGRDVADMWLGKRDTKMSQSDWDRRKRELRHLRDPLEVASFVKKELEKDKSTEMLQLVRMASHSMQCIVSWNHIIDYFLAKERVSDAMKIYNEMKKRAQFPDSYTYTIILRGLSNNAHHSSALSNALSTYYSMSAPNSRVQPSIIHTNAALRVCARALDMDALWGIAAKIPDKGPGAANATTFTTILNAIQKSLLINKPRDETEEETVARYERGIVEGRRVWGDIISKWRGADMAVEEELVCAMGRLLLVGSRPRDWDDVLSLVEQTMDIPRLIPRLGTPERHEMGHPHLRAPHTPDVLRFDDDHLGPNKNPMRGDEFLALEPRSVGIALSRLVYATPGNNTLSMILEACQKIVAPKAANDYWDLLTDPVTYNITPDRNNLHMRLRILRQNRASAAAATLIKEDMADKGIKPAPGTFRIAMSTCVRDRNNHNSLKNANQILQLMMQTLEDADAKVVTMYAQLAISFPLAKADDVVNALTFLQPIVKNIRLQLGVGGRSNYGKSVGATFLTGSERQDALEALKRVYGVYDRLFNSNMIPQEQQAPFKAERARLSAFIQRETFRRGGPRLDLKKPGSNADSDSSVEELAFERDANEGEINQAREKRDRQGGVWRARKVLSAEERKPWFPSLRRSSSTASNSYSS